MQPRTRRQKEVYDYIESHLELVPVGITPIYYNDGYLFLDNCPVKETRLYRYQVSVFENPYETYRGLHLEYIASVKRKLTDTYENLKGNLIRKDLSRPNPATFAIVAKINCPFENSILPVAKRTLLKYVSSLNTKP